MNKIKKVINLMIVIGIFILIIIYSINKLDYTFVWKGVFVYKNKLIKGFGVTLIISFFSMIVSLIIGIITTLFLNSKILALNYFAKGYIGIIRGTPFLVQIYFLYYIIATAFQISNKYLLGIIILSIFTGAYVTEIIRGGLESIEQSQHITSKALGFTTLQKYIYIIIPQVVKRIMPALAGQISSLVKDSSLLSVIAVSEFTMNVLEVDSINFRTFENLTVLGVGYLLITIPISIISKKLERAFSYED
ncbi:amino acid ABC transporter permease [Clostridium sp. ZS2-4]|uniref:amino acid ABC transporter permease n=1 Tax=Clostridium sp. ZS2-4 TaxID=2987703 RepID=UPI00227C2825|nr:amino acid ABC transporter permease [Clostridium sp. ZS2-4]MCY6356878.1 amino acid ABC transporter permease [Clostridium sp. ZS2-4]